jgi:O-antigen/teichoic acid export membrane protein
VDDAHDAAFAAAAADLSTRRFAIGARQNLLGAMAERSIGIAITLILPAVLLPSMLGAYYEIAALFSILTILAVFGLDIGVTRFTAIMSERRRFGEIRPYARSGLAIAAAASCALACLVVALAPALAHAFGSPSMATALRAGAAFIPAMTAAALLVAPSKGLKRMAPAVLAVQVVQPGAQLLLTLLLLWMGRLSLRTAAAALAMSGLLALVVAWWRGRWNRLPKPSVAPAAGDRRGHVTGRLLRFSLAAAGTTLTGTALLWVDTLLLGILRPTSEVAVYGLVVRLLTANAAILLAVTQILGPFAAQLAERRDLPRLQGVLRTATRLVTTLSAPFLALLLLLGVRIVTGLHQRGGIAATALPILCAAFLLDAMTGPVAQVLTMSGRPALNFANNLGGLACNIALNLALIPRLGITGAAVAWAVAIAAINAARLIEVRALLGITPFAPDLWKPAVAVAAAAVSGGATLRWAAGTDLGTAATLVATTVVFGAVYVAAMIGLRPGEEDRRLFRVLIAGAGAPTPAGLAAEVPA